MLKINMELIKSKNANATTRPIGSQIFENLRKLKNFKIFLKSHFFKRHSTSPPCGNQVDGLPHDVHTGAVVKPVPRAPRLFITLTPFGQFFSL